MFDRIPVRLRLSLGHALWMALLFLCIGIGLYNVVKHNLYQTVDASLLTSAQSIRDARFFRGFNSPLMERFLNDFFGEKSIRPYAQLVDLSGKIQAKTDIHVSLPVTKLALTRAEHGHETFETFPLRDPESAPLRQVTLPVIRFGQFSGELVQVGASLESTAHTLREITWVLWISLPFGVGISVVFGYILTKRSLQPVIDMSRAASRLGSADLSVRLPLPRAHDELRRLAETFNEMFDRLEDAFMRLRRFTGDVSHELRTPLAVLLGEAELALRKERTPDHYRMSLKAITSECKNMQEIIENLLLLARAESRAVAMSWSCLVLQDFIQDLLSMVQPVYDQKSVKILLKHGKLRPTFMANLAYLSLALKNILLNAAKHSAPHSQVEFEIKSEGDGLVFIVADQGEGIPAESLPYIFDPFYRADTARNRTSGGTGIGLSLALAMVKLHQGSIGVKSPPGEGATFTIRIPAPPQRTEKQVRTSVLLSPTASIDPVVQNIARLGI